MIVANCSSNSAQIFIGGQTNPTSIGGGCFVEVDLPSTQQYMVSCPPNRQPNITARSNAVIVWDGGKFCASYPQD